MLVHEFIGVKVYRDGGMGIENGHTDKSAGIIPQALQILRKPHAWEHMLESDVGNIESGCEMFQIIFVKRTCKDIFGCAVWKQTHKQVVVRRRSPACITPSSL